MENETNLPVIAAFDFDGTITTRDSLLPFLIENFGFFHVGVGSLFILPQLAGFCMGSVSRQTAKEAILQQFLAGMEKDEFSSRCQAYASKVLPGLVKKEALERIKWHRSQGHTLVLVSASVENYLIPWAIQNEFDQVLSSRFKWTPEQTLTGSLDGLNCWGQEKVRRLEEVYGKKVQDGKTRYILYAYGDSRGDEALLNYADHPFYRKWE